MKLLKNRLISSAYGVLAACAVVAGFLGAAVPASAQEPRFRTGSTVVLVPTLVTTKSGQVIHGLTTNDFQVFDNGVSQIVRLDEVPEQEPLSIVVAVQTGRSAALKIRNSIPQFGVPTNSKTSRNDAPVSGLATMLESYISGRDAEVAVVSFDSQVKLQQDFSSEFERIRAAFQSLAPGDNGAGILDALHFSIQSLGKRPPSKRRVIFLVSETRDHGSRSATLQSIVQELGVSNTLVYSLSFSPLVSELMRDLKGQNPNPGAMNLLAPFAALLNGMRENIATAVADLTGGEHARFGDKGSFDSSIGTLTAHDQNRYFLSFQPRESLPGQHTIVVRVPSRPDAVVAARTMYWATGSSIPSGD